MDKQDFLAKFAEQFEDTDPEEIQLNTVFHELEEWSSIIGMCILALAKAEYGKSISGDELKKCIKVEDVFNLIASK